MMGKKNTNCPKSAKAFAQACGFLPGGVNSPVRAFSGVDATPLFIERAAGSKIYCLDGNEYIDYVGSWGPLVLGHAHPKVVKAVRAAAQKGTSFGAPTLAETTLAEKIVAAFESIEKVRLVNSGTESPRRWARDLVIKMAGCYHGHSDSLLVSAGSGVAEAGIASSAGVPDSLTKLTIVIPYNDIDVAKAAFGKHKGKIAAVLVEPVAANMGVVPPIDSYLETLRRLCDQNDALLVFDEVITGFRLALGGAQELYDIKADITCLGKIIGGGLPIGAIGGRADIMDMLAPAGPVYQAGTLSGNPLATAAANATLDLLDAGDERRGTRDEGRGVKIVHRPSSIVHHPSVYKYLESRSSMLEAGLAEAAKKARIPVTINRVGSIMSCFFTDRPVRNFADVQSTDMKRFKRFFTQMLKQGIYLAPSAYEAMFVSLAHTEQDIEKTVEAAQKSFRKIKD
jgi:glutamate-1-semialdehyde 2,1-aminomutase